MAYLYITYNNRGGNFVVCIKMNMNNLIVGIVITFVVFLSLFLVSASIFAYTEDAYDIVENPRPVITATFDEPLIDIVRKLRNEPK